MLDQHHTFAAALGASCCGSLRAGVRTECSGQALCCLGVPFLIVRGPVDQTRKGAPFGVGVHVQDRRSVGGCDRKRGWDLAFTPHVSLHGLSRGGFGGGCRQGLFGVIILFMSMIGKRRQRDATSAWKSSRKGRCASLVAIAVVF